LSEVSWAGRSGALPSPAYRLLILLGDVFHDWSVRHLCADVGRLLPHVRRLSRRREAEVVWVLANHDRHLGHLAAALLGVETAEAFRWSHAGRAFAAVHGDRFDGFEALQDRGFLLPLLRFAQRRLSTGGE
jgi:UDP-2,3-diacylglucosamine pyrophosphatase LpxH